MLEQHVDQGQDKVGGVGWPLLAPLEALRFDLNSGGTVKDVVPWQCFLKLGGSGGRAGILW